MNPWRVPHALLAFSALVVMRVLSYGLDKTLGEKEEFDYQGSTTPDED